jgi:protoheme IX farnesyltransferase
MFSQIVDVLKLRIGVVMSFTAVVAMMVTPGPSATMTEAIVLTLAVLVASCGAGAFNQYYERDLDALMPRTRNRPFVTGRFRRGTPWLLIMLSMLVVSVAGAALLLNNAAALFVFLGAFFYAVVYTVWLKRRTWLNIVIGGASGSFAVLAGAAVVDPTLGPVPLILAVVLFLWTPPHFWSLAIAGRKDYEAAGIPMLPVVVGDKSAARAILWNTVALVACSILPVFFGLGWLYLVGALSGGGLFIYRSIQLVRAPSRRAAMNTFFASLIQLVALLSFAVLDAL